MVSNEKKRKETSVQGACLHYQTKSTSHLNKVLLHQGKWVLEKAVLKNPPILPTVQNSYNVKKNTFVILSDKKLLQAGYVCYICCTSTDKEWKNSFWENQMKHAQITRMNGFRNIKHGKNYGWSLSQRRIG